jgi:hypothetical protein
MKTSGRNGNEQQCGSGVALPEFFRMFDRRRTSSTASRKNAQRKILVITCKYANAWECGLCSMGLAVISRDTALA